LLVELKGAEELVELVGGVEVGFEFAGAEAFADIVEAAGEEVERGGEHFPVGEDDVAPGGVGTPGEAECVAQSRPCQSDWQASFVQTVVQKRAERDGR